MKVDLFELLDGFFRGVVQFVYSLIASTFWLIRHPLRGPAYLYRSLQAPQRRQVSPITLLFAAYMGAYAYAMRHAYQGPTASLDFDAWWPVLVASLFSTVIVDSALRLAVRLRFRQRRQGEFVLATTEYAMALPSLPVSILLLHAARGVLFQLVGAHGRTWGWIGIAAIPWLEVLGAFALAAVLVVPASRCFRSGGYLRSRAGRPRAKRASISRWSRRWVALVALTMAASSVGGTIRDYAYAARVAASEVRVAILACHLEPKKPPVRPFIEALLVNRSRRPVLLGDRDLFLYVGPILIRDAEHAEAPSPLTEHAVEKLFFHLQLAGGGGSDLLRPGESKLVRAVIILGPEQKGFAAGYGCLLNGFGQPTYNQLAYKMTGLPGYID